MKNTRLIIALVSSLLDEGLIIGLLLWGLPKLGISIPIPITIIIVILFALFAIITFKLGSRVLNMKPLPGLTDLKGVEGRVVKRLALTGFIKIDGELWEARSLEDIIEIGTEVVVVSQSGLKLGVKKKTT